MSHCIPSHIDTCDLFLCLFSPGARVLPPREPLLLRPLPPRLLVPGANVSTIIFCDVSRRLSQSIDLNIRLARLISYKRDIYENYPEPIFSNTLDFVQGIIKVSFISSPGLLGFFPMTRNLDWRSL